MSCTGGDDKSLRLRPGSAAAALHRLSLRMCPKCSSKFRPDPGYHGPVLCPECRENFVRNCRECNRPYRIDIHPGFSGLCPTCYYIVYDDDGD